MGTDNQGRKLAHHEKPIWRKAFEEAMKHTSIEGATRNAWKAVDAWNAAGAFNESNSQRPERSIESGSQQDYREAFGILREWLGTLPDVSLRESEVQRLWETVLAFDDGEIDVKGLQSELKSIVPTA